MLSINSAWLVCAGDLIDLGRQVDPRGQLTYELPQRTVTIDMRRPVLTLPSRKLSYQFMAAEAHWILSGDDRVSTIAPYNKHIGAFSDDGLTFAGAYGPRIHEQLLYIVTKLTQDPSSRQAGLTIWMPNPQPSKDIPCTVAIWFQVREGKLNLHVFMRSSDVWLGLPYDLFNFSMLGHLVCSMLRKMDFTRQLNALEPGTLYLTAASLHLYDRNRSEVLAVLKEEEDRSLPEQPMTPEAFFTDQAVLMGTLAELRTSRATDRLRWWIQ